MPDMMNKLKRFVSIFVIAAFCSVALSACSPNHTEVGGWWYDNQWASADQPG